MKKNLRLLAFVAVGAAASLGFSSCAYDPYYGSSTVGGSYSSGGGYSVGGSYSSGYGDGYGYGGSNFNTSVFVSTGNPQWGYDPYCYSYYDYSRRCYYDPYLNGYYPIGYRPAVVYGVPHPYGWSGHGYCPPPRHVSNVTVVNYRNRESAYHNTNYGWAKQVRQQAPSSNRAQQQRPNQSQQNYNRPTNGSRPQASSGYQNQSRPQASQPSRSGSQSANRQQAQSRYNAPVTTYSQQQQKNTQRNNGRAQPQANQRPQLGNPGNGRSQPQQPRAQGGRNKGQGQVDENGKPIRGYR
ncbi:MAG: hypothetical protein ABIT37_06945 [Luteolibacter sp.]